MFPGGLAIGEQEKQAVMKVLESRCLFRYYGPQEFTSFVSLFETDLANHINAKYVLGVSSGTGALVTVFSALGVGPGDEVIIPAYTFIASATAVLAAKAIPVIAEIDESLTLDLGDVERKITAQTKAILAVHMRGVPCDMEGLRRLAEGHGIEIIEDVAQAMGGRYRHQHLGTLGRINAFSLQFHKVITCGEGGVVVTDNPELAYRARMYHDSAGFWRFGSDSAEFAVRSIIPGVNYRMSEIQGALASVQLSKLEDLLGKMRRNKRLIKDGIQDLHVLRFRPLHDAAGETAICLVFYLPEAPLARRFASALRAENVSATTIYEPGRSNWHVYADWRHILEKQTVTSEGCPYSCPYYHGEVNYSPDMCPRTLALLSRAVHLDISPDLTTVEVEETIEAIRKVVKGLGLE